MELPDPRSQLPESTPPLPNERFDVILADPPWHYKQVAGSPLLACPYPTLDLAQMCRLRVQDIAKDNSVLFLWTTSTFMEQSIQLMRAWGFSYVCVLFVWVKHYSLPGAYTLPRTEFVLLGKKGQSSKVLHVWASSSKNPPIQQVFLDESKRPPHSQKPAEIMRRMTDLVLPGKLKIELFCRKPVPGWCAWGDNVQTPDETEPPDDIMLS